MTTIIICILFFIALFVIASLIDGELEAQIASYRRTSDFAPAA